MVYKCSSKNGLLLQGSQPASLLASFPLQFGAMLSLHISFYVMSFFVVFCFSFWSLVVVQLQPTYIYPSPKQRIMKINTSHWKVVCVFPYRDKTSSFDLIEMFAYFVYIDYIRELDLCFLDLGGSGVIDGFGNDRDLSLARWLKRDQW